MSSGIHSSKMQGVFIPDDSTPNKPMEELNFTSPESPYFTKNIRQLLGCPLEEMEPMYSEELMSIFDGNDNGLPPGRHFVAYEAWMDENGNATRPKNSRVANLFTRPRSHGPMLFVKTIYVKDPYTGFPRVVRREPLPISELESLAFQDKRKEYVRKESAHRDRVIAESEAAGWITVVL